MKNLTLRIKKVVLFTGDGVDRLSLTLDTPTPFPKFDDEAYAEIRVSAGFGKEWCKQALGLDVDFVIKTD